VLIVAEPPSRSDREPIQPLPLNISSLLSRMVRGRCRAFASPVGVTKAQPQLPEEAGVTGSETGQVTGTKDKDYDIIWFTEAC
jgi:hypothetical protein